MDKKNSLAKNSIYYLIYNVLNILFPFITGIYVSRVLLPDGVGAVAYAQNIAQYFVILAFLGIPTYGLREIAKVKDDKEQLNRLYSELFIINFVSTIIFLSIYIGLVCAVPKFNQDLSLYLVVGILIAMNVFNISWLYEGLEEFKFESVRSIIFKAVSFVFLVLLVKGPEDVLWYAAVTVVGTAGNYIVNIIYHGKFAHFTLKNLQFKRHIKPIMYLVAVNLAIEIYTMVDTTMIGIFCAEENVAFYSYGSKIQKILLQVVNTFTMVVVPRLSLYYKIGDQEQFNKLLSDILRVILILSIPMVIGTQFVAVYVIEVLYTETYLPAALVLRILSVLLIISPIGYLLGSRVCLVTGHENKMLISVAVGAVVNVIGNLFLIPRFSETGAAIASVISEVIVMIIYIIQSFRFYKLISVWKNLIKIILAAGIMTGCLFLCELIPVSIIWKLIIEVVSAVVVYFVVLVILREEDISKVCLKLRQKLTKS